MDAGVQVLFAWILYLAACIYSLVLEQQHPRIGTALWYLRNAIQYILCQSICRYW
jgi:hypothetical protein